MKLTKEECLELGKQYVLKHNCYPSSKKWAVVSAGCSKDRIYENWGNWPNFIEELQNLINIGPYKGSAWNKGTIVSKTLLENKYCLHCNKIFNSYKKEQKYCSGNCANFSPKLGGVREGSGRSKTGYCEGIYCGSTYELAWVVYNLDNNIQFSRCTDVFSFGNKKYYPDFIQGNTIIEIKGFWSEEVDLKSKAVISAGKQIKVLYKKDLKYCFDWIKENYNCPIEWLFDTYKPAYKYTCSYCKAVFNTDKKRKTDTVFCSRQCSGKNLKN
jgi:hypothetical protein